MGVGKWGSEKVAKRCICCIRMRAGAGTRIGVDRRKKCARGAFFELSRASWGGARGCGEAWEVAGEKASPFRVLFGSGRGRGGWEEGRMGNGPAAAGKLRWMG